MKLICFSNNTAGGLICDLLNNQAINLKGYQTTSKEHSLFKIGDTPTVQWTVDRTLWDKALNNFRNDTRWVGTHCHPSGIPDLTIFDKVICITTTTKQSKLYRWLRYYYGWFLTVTPKFIQDQSLESIDKCRILCKNVFEEFTPYINCINIEFEDIVNGNFIKQSNLNLIEFEKWKQANKFLYNYSADDWAVKRFNEAEHEVLTNTPFRYF